MNSQTNNTSTVQQMGGFNPNQMNFGSSNTSGLKSFSNFGSNNNANPFNQNKGQPTQSWVNTNVQQNNQSWLQPQSQSQQQPQGWVNQNQNQWQNNNNNNNNQQANAPWMSQQQNPTPPWMQQNNTGSLMPQNNIQVPQGINPSMMQPRK